MANQECYALRAPLKFTLICNIFIQMTADNITSGQRGEKRETEDPGDNDENLSNLILGEPN